MLLCCCYAPSLSLFTNCEVQNKCLLTRRKVHALCRFIRSRVQRKIISFQLVWIAIRSLAIRHKRRSPDIQPVSGISLKLHTARIEACILGGVSIVPISVPGAMGAEAYHGAELGEPLPPPTTSFEM